MVIFRRLVIFLCLASLAFAQHTPRPCADVPIKTTDNKIIHIPQYKGKVVMVVMMLTYCEGCLKTLEFLRRLQTEFGPRGFQVVGISLDESSVPVVPLQERYRFPFPMGHLEPKAVIKLADLSPTAHPTVPYVMFIDWMGQVRFQYPGNDPFFNETEKNIRTIADGLLRQAAEKKGPQYQTMPAGK